MLKVLLIGLAVVTPAGLSGVAGWRLAIRHDTAVRAEAAEIAEHRCQKFVARWLFAQGVTRSGDPSDLDFTDPPRYGTGPNGVLVGADSGGHLVAAVVGDLRAVTADGKQITYRFECRLSSYDSDDRRWAVLTGTAFEAQAIASANPPSDLASPRPQASSSGTPLNVAPPTSP
ncbi:MAG TPA: hypothetical protein VFC19_31780 [Candidatus Limnocylindrales bacterium]|nr:hypothetical protein [Candidatus Limnocylindrales bacterium]